jgi:hypothetical protein
MCQKTLAAATKAGTAMLPGSDQQTAIYHLLREFSGSPNDGSDLATLAVAEYKGDGESFERIAETKCARWT